MIEGYRNFTTKLWNAARLCLMSGAAHDPDFDPARAKLAINRWIVAKLARTGRALDEAFDTYRFDEAANLLYHFTWGQFCDLYLEFTKPVLQGDDEVAAAETRAAMAWVAGRLLRLLHPIMPYITEELWEHLGDGSSEFLMLADWPDFPDALIDTEAEAEIDWIARLIGEVRSVRAEMNVPPGARVPLLLRDADETARSRVEAHAGLLAWMARNL